MDKLREYLKAERGRLKSLAGRLGISPSTVLTWHKVPPGYALTIEELTGVSRYDLRPDIYGPKPEAAE